MKNRTMMRLALGAVALILLFALAGCMVKPDDTVDQTPTNPINVLPFETATAQPTAPPQATGQPGWETWGTQTGAIVVTNPPTAIPTIGIITATPTQVQPAFTIAPTQRPTTAPTDDGMLRVGTSGSKVTAMQQRLKTLGYYTGTVDGTFGTATEAALKSFQSANGLTADGVAGPATLAKLNASSAVPKITPYATSRPTPSSYTASTPSTYRYLQLGSSGSDVTRLQNRLKELGYFSAATSGTFNDATETAVRAFQQRNGLWVDGVAGEDTQRMLFSSAALPFEGAVQATAGTYRTLKQGLIGEDVRELQIRLSDLFYYAGAFDGSYGASTTAAVKAFQTRNGLAADGVAGSGTQQALFAPGALPAATVSPSVTQYPATGTLSKGSTGQAVYALQERLYDLGYYTGRVDGIYSDQVTIAVSEFQAMNGLTVDGKAGTATQTKIYSASAKRSLYGANTYTTIRPGETGERVRALQGSLLSYGYFTGTVDGQYGGATQTAVQQFQAMNGLAPDGIAGPATLMLLYEGSPRSYAVAAPTQTVHQTLKQGMSGADVLMLQEELNRLGYFGGTINGFYDATTTLAVSSFQARNGLTADGIAGSQTQALLYSGTAATADVFAPTAPRATLRSQDEGADVMQLQQRLIDLGYLTGFADGKYGASTVAAVVAFQRSNNLNADGVAGPGTQTALYAAGVVTAITPTLTAISNRSRELEEQSQTGALQTNLAGGGVAASYNNRVYTVSARGLTVTDTSGTRTLYEGAVSYLHASAKGLTFVSGSRILRVGLDGLSTQVLVNTGSVRKLSVVGDTLFYLEGSTLVRMPVSGTPSTLAVSVNDFAIDLFDSVCYLATPTGIRRMGLTGGADTVITSTACDQVLLCDAVILFRAGGAVYRLANGIPVLITEASASWMGVYRDYIYYISDSRLFRCTTTGQEGELFYDGVVANVSFVAGKAYITQQQGGAVTQILPTE